MPYVTRMRRFLLLALTLPLAGCPATGAAEKASDNARCAEAGRISGQKAKAMIATGATLLDVRTGLEFSSRHLPGAKNVPVDEVASRLNEIPKGAPVIVYCQSGNRSRTAAQVLKSAGYDVHDLGGIGDFDTTDC